MTVWGLQGRGCGEESRGLGARPCCPDGGRAGGGGQERGAETTVWAHHGTWCFVCLVCLWLCEVSRNSVPLLRVLGGEARPSAASMAAQLLASPGLSPVERWACPPPVPAAPAGTRLQATPTCPGGSWGRGLLEVGG